MYTYIVLPMYVASAGSIDLVLIIIISCLCSTDAQAPPKGPYIKMFSPEQVTALAHMFKEVIDNYSDQNGASEYLSN